LFSTLKTNNLLVSAFKGECVVIQGTTAHTPRDIYSACFTSGRESIAYSIIPAEEKATATPQQVSELNERVNRYSRELELNYRDTRRWKYTLEGSTNELSFDEATLSYLNMKAGQK